MARQSRVAADQLTGVAATLTAFELSGVDLIVEIDPSATHHVDFKANSSGTTDPCKFTFYVSNKDSTPGDVPDGSRALAGSDWAILLEVIIDSSDSDQENVWQELLIRGYRYWACSVIRDSGSSDTFTCDLGYSSDGE